MIVRTKKLAIRLLRGIYNRTVLRFLRFAKHLILVATLPRMLVNDGLYKTFIKRAPTNILIFPTNICNANCTFCAYSTNEDKKLVMGFEIAKQAIDEYVAMGGKSICFTPNLGDSLVDKQLLKKLDYARKCGIDYLYLYTNGILLSKRHEAVKLIDLLDAIYISSPGFSKDAYVRLFRVDKCDQVVDGILLLSEYKRTTSSSTKISLEFRLDRPLQEVMHDEGMKPLLEYIEDGTIELGVPITEMDNWGGTIDEKALSGTMKLKNALVEDRRLPCQMLFVNPGILPDGAIRVCSCWYAKTNYDELTLDNIRDSPLSTVLFGDAHRNILTKWTQNELPTVCKTCTYYRPFNMEGKSLINAVTSLAIGSPKQLH